MRKEGKDRVRSIAKNNAVAGTVFFMAPLLFSASDCLKIHHLWVPDVMRNASGLSAILDCDYTLHDRDKDSLEVKWYFRYDQAPIYQWIPPDEPQVLGKFLGHVNLGYRATTDPYSERRALHLMGITTEFSGRYSCRVSSIYEDEFRSKEMIIYAPPISTDINLVWVASNTLNVTCGTVGAYPEPEVKLLVKDIQEDYSVSYDVTSEAAATRRVLWDGSTYSVHSWALLRFPLNVTIQKATGEERQRTITRISTAIVCRFTIAAAGFKHEEERRVAHLQQGFFGTSGNTSSRTKVGKEILVTLFVLAQLSYHFQAVMIS